jgi:hypothetical protein
VNPIRDVPWKVMDLGLGGGTGKLNMARPAVRPGRGREDTGAGWGLPDNMCRF